MTPILSTYSTSSSSDAPGLRRAGRSQNERLVDRFGRTIDHLRLSVTAACNLRCLYCRVAVEKSEPWGWSDEQRSDLVKFLYERYGLQRVRLTGGEPLLHASIVSLVARLREACPDISLAMTTNGGGLAASADDLRRAGLDRINVSLDTIDPRTYRALTGGDLAPVLVGIERCFDVGFPPPKLNVVVIRGVNDDCLADLVRWAFSRDMEIRFLEAMPIGPTARFNRQRFVSATEIRARLAANFDMTPLAREWGETAARYSTTVGGVSGIVGIIAPMTESFCGQCRRIRVTVDGKLFPCLLDTRHADLSTCWRDNAFQPERASRLIRDFVWAKRASGPRLQDTAMVQLGG